MNRKIFTVVVYREEDMYIAECLEIRTIDQGATIEEAIANVKEATRLYLEETNVPNTQPPFVTSIEVEYA